MEELLQYVRAVGIDFIRGDATREDRERLCKNFFRRMSPDVRARWVKDYEGLIAGNRIPWMTPHYRNGLAWLQDVRNELKELV